MCERGVYHASFCKEVNLPAETLMEWTSTGKVKVSVNGKEAGNSDKSSLTLPKGKSTLLFKVETDNDLPAIKVSFNGEVSTDHWKASMDGTEWNIAETSPVFGTAGRMPLDDPETEVTIHPDIFWLTFSILKSAKYHSQPKVRESSLLL